MAFIVSKEDDFLILGYLWTFFFKAAFSPVKGINPAKAPHHIPA